MSRATKNIPNSILKRTDSQIDLITDPEPNFDGPITPKSRMKSVTFSPTPHYREYSVVSNCSEEMSNSSINNEPDLSSSDVMQSVPAPASGGNPDRPYSRLRNPFENYFRLTSYTSLLHSKPYPPYGKLSKFMMPERDQNVESRVTSFAVSDPVDLPVTMGKFRSISTQTSPLDLSSFTWKTSKDCKEIGISCNLESSWFSDTDDQVLAPNSSSSFEGIFNMDMTNLSISRVSETEASESPESSQLEEQLSVYYQETSTTRTPNIWEIPPPPLVDSSMESYENSDLDDEGETINSRRFEARFSGTKGNIDASDDKTIQNTVLSSCLFPSRVTDTLTTQEINDETHGSLNDRDIVMSSSTPSPLSGQQNQNQHVPATVDVEGSPEYKKILIDIYTYFDHADPLDIFAECALVRKLYWALTEDLESDEEFNSVILRAAEFDLFSEELTESMKRRRELLKS